jgi:predicted AlkP superfamily phosphohydrolase/phosphomutase
MRGGEQAYLAQVERLHTKSVESAKLLLEWYKPDLFFMTLQGIDMVQHDFSRYMEKPGSEYSNVVRDWYVRLDEAFGELRTFTTPETYVLVLSDHGSMPITTSFHVNEYLRSQGILTLKSTLEKKGREIYTPLRRFILKTLPPNAIRTVYRLTPDRLAHKLTVSAQHERTLTRLVDSIDWTNTKAFSTGGPQAAIYINSTNYDGGVLQDPERRAELVEGLENMLGDLTHPSTGERIRAVYHRREDTFNGPYQMEAPDLAVELFGKEEKIHINITLGSGRIWSFAPHLSSEHVREGFWTMAGPGVPRDLRLDASILDLAPTLQKLLRLEVSRDVDGKILSPLLSQSFPVQTAN